MSTNKVVRKNKSTSQAKPSPKMSHQQIVEAIEKLENDLKLDTYDGATRRSMEEKLAKLRTEQVSSSISDIKQTSIQIGRMIEEKKIPSEQFVRKIDLSGKCDEPDPTYQIVTSSRKYFEKLDYVKPPPEGERLIEKEVKKGSGFGNKKLPADLARKIYR